MKIKLSLHPYFAAALEALIGIVMFWWLVNIPNQASLGAWIPLRFIFTAFTAKFVFCPPPLSRWRLFFEIFFLELATTGLVIIIDSPSVRTLAAVGGVALAVLSFALLPKAAEQLSFAFKPARRARLMAAAFTIFGFSSSLYAASTLQLIDRIITAVLGLAFLVFTTGVSVLWWREYNINTNKRTLTAALVLNLIIIEFGFFTWWLPVGYLAAGFLVAWWWYGWWLLMRFSLTPEGVRWKAQTPLLVINALAFLAYLVLIVRWK